ncbi:MAG: hypothetical protein LBF16_11225 [Pseudomonadales bacterium]|jgi:hypothetical protein|nr:hypothetical protein [Pseudomonadales bacterium]
MKNIVMKSTIMKSIAMKRAITTFAFLLGLASAPAFSQQAYPLSGTWQGDWGVNDKDRNFLTLVMDWDGKAVSGSANPGPDSTQIEHMTLNSANWTVAIDMPLKDAKGQTVQFKGEGAIADLGSQTRSISGTWSDGARKGTFTLTRQSGG